MQQTLFFIPHSWLGLPLLIAWVVVAAVCFGWQVWRAGWQSAMGLLPVLGFVTLIVWFVLPQLEVPGVNPQDPTGPLIPVGIAIRGYGMFMLLGIAAGTALVLMRCRQASLDPDLILTLAFWMVISGILGARLFYVIQKSDEFFGTGQPLVQTLVSIVDMTKGGLVVYGSLIGAMLAAIVFFRRTQMPFRQTADLLAPGMAIGLAFGRIGCLMNGCCYGGVCQTGLPAIEFPAGAPPYMQQLDEGKLLGMELKPGGSSDTLRGDFRYEVTEVESNSIAGRLNLQPGDHVNIFAPDNLRVQHYKTTPLEKLPADQELVLYIDSQQQGQLSVPLASLPPRSLPVHPTQIYSAISAAMLCALLWFYWPVRTIDGEVFALMLILYPIARYLIEIIRSDEAGQFGTTLTISQWVSIVAIAIGFAAFGWFRRASQING